MLNIYAEALDFNYEAVEFECSGQIDARGYLGVPGVSRYFDKVDLIVRLYTKEAPVRVALLRKNAEYRCPVLHMMRDAGVELLVYWQFADPIGVSD